MLLTRVERKAFSSDHLSSYLRREVGIVATAGGLLIFLFLLRNRRSAFNANTNNHKDVSDEETIFRSSADQLAYTTPHCTDYFSSKGSVFFVVPSLLCPTQPLILIMFPPTTNRPGDGDRW